MSDYLTGVTGDEAYVFAQCGCGWSGPDHRNTPNGHAIASSEATTHANRGEHRNPYAVDNSADHS